ncbi:zona pellucida sperm-binding protein 3 isoform X2 [Etheostoma cragini]|uniref:zona pellucida sperm-binding protein 3 isoform X2 n=1 Tax=Etheostoma cragini TaxID=417921 RepID=UPI00155E1A49|nr:zona pellucida sperm-binding protein 3 isoform X2 [Etheostoma cragini]
MKTKWRPYILWSVFSLCLLNCAIGTYESPFTRKKQVFKLGGTLKSQSIKQSRTDDRKSSRRLPTSTSPMSPLSSQRPYPPLTPRPMRPGDPEAKIQAEFAYLPDVSVTCSASDVVVRVKPAFYGLGAGKEELKLGSACKSNGVLRPYGDLLFTYPLTACDAVRESPTGYLLYKYELHYEPSPKRSSQRINVDIECRYRRSHHVHRLTVRPTWETAIMHKRLKGSPNDFHIELMDDSWRTPAKSLVYELGKTVNFQVSAPHLSTRGKLYIKTCYATPYSGLKSNTLKYTIIDDFGCLLDSKSDPGASQFISRTDNTLRFSLKAFQFNSDPYTEVRIHCKLFVTPEDPGPAHKSCTYRGNGWKALTGDNSICECCDSKCVTSKHRRAMMEGSASSGSLLVSDQPYAEDGFLPVNMNRDETLWKSAEVVKYADNDKVQDYADKEEDEESGVVNGVITEPDLDELGFWRRVLVKKSEGEDGSGYVLEEGFKGGEDEIHLNQKEGEVLRHWREVNPLASESREENGKHTDRGEDRDGTTASEVEWKTADSLADFREDSEMTWYFKWS